MKGENIATRLLGFEAGVVRLCRRLPDDASAKHIARQLVRAATGGGANYEEARGAESRFYRMARRSATETAATLDILERRKSVSPDLIQPARELIVRVVSMLARLASK